MPVAPTKLTAPKLLLGEGIDEVRFFKAFLTHLNVTDVQVMDYGGKTKLGPFLKTLTILPGFSALTSLAVTRDADANAAGAFQSVSAALQGAGLPVPPAHASAAGGAPRVHVFVLPDGARPGMLETVCLESVKSSPAFRCVEDYFECALRAAARQPNNQAKAFLHAWLASEVEPDKRLGEAAEAGYWNWHDPAFAALRSFLLALWPPRSGGCSGRAGARKVTPGTYA
jgi:hypothetical protein